MHDAFAEEPDEEAGLPIAPDRRAQAAAGQALDFAVRLLDAQAVNHAQHIFAPPQPLPSATVGSTGCCASLDCRVARFIAMRENWAGRELATAAVGWVADLAANKGNPLLATSTAPGVLAVGVG